MGILLVCADQIRRSWGRAIVVEHTDYSKPTPNQMDLIPDDMLNVATIPVFDPDRVDSRPANGWLVNLSASVTQLDLDMLLPDQDAELLKLWPSYAEALNAVQTDLTVLPSVNLIDGKAKQFDDGLYAALEDHWFQAKVGDFRGDLDFLQRLAAAVPEDSRAAAFFSVGLEMAGITVAATNQPAKSAWKARFNSREVNWKPIGFYDWTPKLQQCYRVSRFFQLDVALDDIQWMDVIVDAFHKDSDLQADYRRILARWARLSNAPWQLSVQDLLDHPDPADLKQLIHKRKPVPTSVSLIPAGTNRESEFVRRIFPSGFSGQTDLIRELMAVIRRGEIDLQPTEQSGWYDYEVYALETLLVPKRGQEANRLLLSGNYKRRMFEAFQAMMTKRKETQVLRSESGYKTASAPPEPLKRFSPRLRLEPAPTYYLRMARSYRFLETAVRDLVGESQLAQIHGLTKEGSRARPLLAELLEIQRLFYGCYALSAEDIGLELKLSEDELPQLSESKILAEKWLLECANDPDLKVDTRVIVPVAEDPQRGVMSTWAAIGVRFARIKASYHPDTPPRVKTADAEKWKSLMSNQLGKAEYLIVVDEFASIQLPNRRVLAREEFRKLCNENLSRIDLVHQLKQLGPSE